MSTNTEPIQLFHTCFLQVYSVTTQNMSHNNQLAPKTTCGPRSKQVLETYITMHTN